jgi:hypothetical protein
MVDRLELLNGHVEKYFRRLAKKYGRPAGGYAYYLDLAKTEAKLPVRLYCDGRHTKINKIQFEDVAHLGLSRVWSIAKKIFGSLRHVKIYRVDLSVDINGIPLRDLALYCRLARVHNCRIERSGAVFSYYLRYTKNHKLLFYDKVAQLRAKYPALAERFRRGQELTRVEVQLRSSALPYKYFSEIEKYKDLDLLSTISFWEWERKRADLKPIEALAADGLLGKINECGLQMAMKAYSSPTAASLQKKFFVRAPRAKFPDLNELLKRSIRDWMADRIRFTRTRRRSHRGAEQPSIAQDPHVTLCLFKRRARRDRTSRSPGRQWRAQHSLSKTSARYMRERL